MQSDPNGVTDEIDIMFAFPRKDGKWDLRRGKMTFVDGLHHKIKFEGFETRSGEGFGITATYYTVQHDSGTDEAMNIGEMTVINGAVKEMKIVAKNVAVIYPE